VIKNEQKRPQTRIANQPDILGLGLVENNKWILLLIFEQKGWLGA